MRTYKMRAIRKLQSLGSTSLGRNSLLGVFVTACLVARPTYGEPVPLDAKTIVRNAIEYWRDSTSYTLADMTIHRAGWERQSTMKAWTKGRKLSLVRFVAPAKDAGNASLSIGDDIWSFSPKVNKVIRIPPSMMSQSWMGSDFSYQDLAKSDHIIDEYDHRLLRTETIEGVSVHVVESVPHETAAVVWGKEILWIREDLIVVRHEFYDQDSVLVKVLTARSIREMGGKKIAADIRMEKVDGSGEWTEVRHREARFGFPIRDAIFTEANLRNPREEQS